MASYKVIKSKILPFIKMKSNSIFSVHDVYGVKLLSRLRLNVRHLNEHKFDNQDGTNCMCDCGSQPQEQYSLSCNASSIKQRD